MRVEDLKNDSYVADRKAATVLLTASFCDFFPSAKIKNIIFTEEAKAKLLAEQRNKKKDHGTSFVPTNIAVNYVQHNRCESRPSVNIDPNLNSEETPEGNER